MVSGFVVEGSSRAVNLPRLQILIIDGEGMIDDVIIHGR